MSLRGRGFINDWRKTMLRKLSCLFVFASMAAACGTEDPGSNTSTTEPTVNALEASGVVEFFVRIKRANGNFIIGDAFNSRFAQSIPAIRFYSDVNKGSTGLAHCTAFRFTKQVDRSSSELAATVASGESLQSVHMDFIHPNPNGDGTITIFQQVDLTGMRSSMVEQATAPVDNLSPSVLLEEVTLVPASSAATYTLTSFAESAGGGSSSIAQTFTCRP